MVYGFIGLGNMAGAILRGMAGSGSFASDTLCGFNRSPGKTQSLAHEIGLVPCESAKEVAEKQKVTVSGFWKALKRRLAARRRSMCGGSWRRA